MSNIGAHKSIIAVVAGKTNAIMGKATIGIPNPSVPLTKPPPKTANIIIKIMIGSFPLYGSLIYYGFATKQDLIVSVALIIPAFIAQQLGTKIRDKINQKQFRICVLTTLIVLGFSLLIKTL